MTPSTRSLRAQIERHVYRNPEDWSVEYLFDALGAFDASNPRFTRFLEGLVSSDIRPDEASQRRLVEKVNVQLRVCSAELRETGAEGGYPVFAAVAVGAPPAGRPKQLIFASSIKTDLRFRDAVSNDIEIVTNADKVLVYDRPIGAEGLRWCDLQSWWSDIANIPDEDKAKATLYRRLQSSLPTSSPPQRTLFDTFHRVFAAAIPRLPALLPEVVALGSKDGKGEGCSCARKVQNGLPDASASRIKNRCGVDGKHHYAHPDGQADPGRYAELAAADRDLKLAGYEVFRFGAEELRGESAALAVKRYFDQLFRRYAVPYS